MDVCILASPAPEFLIPAKRLAGALRAAGRVVTLQLTDTGGRYAFFRRLARSGAVLFVYLGHGSAAGWAAWGTTGAGYLNALEWHRPIECLVNLTCQGNWARTQVQREWVHAVWATHQNLTLQTVAALVNVLIEQDGQLQEAAMNAALPRQSRTLSPCKPPAYAPA